MSRIGYAPIPIPQRVKIEIKDGNEVTIEGPRGKLTQTFHPDIKIVQKDGVVKVERPSDENQHKALHGLTRALLANMVRGVSEGYTRSLELVGVGYRAQLAGKGLTLNLMFTHQVSIEPVEGITFEVEGNNRIHVRGIDKQLVGQVAANIRAKRPPNAYTGKGVRYAGEQIRLKPGKSARRT
ncbi:MAG: 50S ribosomal protein L6 [Chloroflexi bacterium]|nr:50S ribosomal protein L6 [Chloroflexota bacterium]